MFKKGERDNPKINSILVVKGSLSDTDYDIYKSQFEEYERAQMEKERKQREFKKITPDADFEDFEDDFVDTGIHADTGFSFFSFSFLGIALFIGYILYTFLGKLNKDKDD